MENTTLNNLLQTILETSFTQMQALARLRILKETLMAKLFTAPLAPPINLTPSDKQWLDGLDVKFLDQFDHKNFSTLIELSEKEIKKMPTLTVVLPFELPEKEARETTNRLRKDYGKTFLIETKYDRSLIAGPALIWKGVYKDYSLRQKIEEKKEKLLQMFQSSRLQEPIPKELKNE